MDLKLSHFDLLETKRKHVRKYSEKIPEKQLIEDALWKAWKTTPGKNNAMAYEVLVWGPDMQIYKEAIHSLCVKSHKAAEDRAVADESLPEIQKTQKGEPNPFYEHVKHNPYLLTIHSRISKPNPFYQLKIKDGHFYDQGYESHIPKIVDSVAVEVGIFAGNLTNYLLESGLDMSYNSCFKRDVKSWHNVGLTMVKQRPILMVTIGYAEKYRRDLLKEWGKDKLDYKPDIKEIVRWL